MVLHENNANSLPITLMPKQISYEDKDFCREMDFLIHYFLYQAEELKIKDRF